MAEAAILEQNLTDLSWLIAARKVSAVEALEATLARLRCPRRQAQRLHHRVRR